MIKRVLKIFICVAIVLSLMSSYALSASAIEVNSLPYDFNIRKVKVVLNTDSVSIHELLSGYDYTYYWMPAGNTEELQAVTVHFIAFTDTSPENVLSAINTLNDSPYVNYISFGRCIYESLEASSTIMGDADDDGVVTIADATCVQRYLAGLTKVINYRQANISNTGTLTIRDATIIQMLLAKYDIYKFIVN